MIIFFFFIDEIRNIEINNTVNFLYNDDLVNDKSILFISIFPNIITVLFFLAIIGGCTACFDAVQWLFIQKNIPDEFRSTAVSAWFITIGFGWIGHFFLGYSSDKFGLEITIMTTGIILIFSGLIYFILSRKY